MEHYNTPLIQRKPVIGILLAIMICLTGSSCNGKKNSPKAAGTAAAQSSCSKGMATALKTWQMPPELVEISGISWIDDTRTAAIQDEQGIIFIYNLKDERVETRIDFGLAGDYEGISMVNGNYFVVRADGYLFEIDAAGTILNEYDLPLTVNDNIESFHYDASNKRLLIGQKDGSTDTKSIYSFDITTRKFNGTPVFTIDPGHPAIACVNMDGEERNAKKKSKKYKPGRFRPSDLAIHPKTKDMYIADGPNQRILVLSQDGRPKHYLGLDIQVHPKAEGLMFSPDGDLYVSSEGVKKAGNISKVAVTMNE